MHPLPAPSLLSLYMLSYLITACKVEDEEIVGCIMRPQHLEARWLLARLQRQFTQDSCWALHFGTGMHLLHSSLPPLPVGATCTFPEKGSLPLLAQFCLLTSTESLCPNCWPRKLMNKGDDKFPLTLHCASGMTHPSAQSHPQP